MDKALACNTHGPGSNLDTTKDFFNSEKLISTPIFSGTPEEFTLSLPKTWSNPENS